MSLDYKGKQGKGGDGGGLPGEWVVIGNSKTIAVGEAVLSYSNSGSVTNGGAGLPLLGVVNALGKGSGKLPSVQGGHTAGSVNASDTTSITTAADNTTTLLWWALVDTSRDSVYSAQVSGTLGTTAGSPTVVGFRGGAIDIDSANTNYDRVLETTHTVTVGDMDDANFSVIGVDPQATGRLLVHLSNTEDNPSA